MVTSISKDTYPAVILLIALLGVYHTSMSLVITSIGILVIHLSMNAFQKDQSWTFLAAVVSWILLWNIYSFYGSRMQGKTAESFIGATRCYGRGCTYYSSPPRPKSKSPPPKPTPPPPPPIPKPPAEYTSTNVAAPIVAATAAAVTTQLVDPSEGISKRPCQIYFTKRNNERACDDGLFFKDFAELKNLQNVKEKAYVQELSKKQTYLKELAEYESILDAAITNKDSQSGSVWGDPTKSVQNYLTKQYDKTIDRERQKASLQDTVYIAQLEQKKKEVPVLAKRIVGATYASYLAYDNKAYTINRTNQKKKVNELKAIMEKDVAKLKTYLKQIRSSEEYERIDRVIQERTKKGENMRCKNIYNGWDEIASRAKPSLHDPIKSTTRAAEKQLGDPFTWAYCYQQNASEEEWAKKQAAFEEKKDLYPDISYAAQPVPAGKGHKNGKNQFTSRISFNKFNPGDMSECDDTLTTPDYPIIPNGLMEIQLNEREDTIKSIRRIMYKGKETRYIDPVLTKNIGEVDVSLLRRIFYTEGFAISLTRPPNAPLGWQRSIRFFLKPNPSVKYDVYYLYFDTKCNRFIGNTNKTTYGINTNFLGPSKVGDLIGYSSTNLSKIYFPEGEIVDSDTIDRIIRKVPGFITKTSKDVVNSISVNNITLLQNDRNSIVNKEIPLIDAEIDKQKLIKKTNEEKLRPYIEASTCNKTTQNRQLCAGYRKAIDTANGVIVQKQQEIETLAKIANNIQTFINIISNSVLRIGVGETLQSYVGKPVTSFVRSYNPSYLSNNRTFYLKITALTSPLPTASTAAFLHDPATDAASVALLQIKNPTLADILEERTTYEAAITFDESEFDNYGIDPTMVETSSTSYQPSTTTYVQPETFVSSTTQTKEIDVYVELLDETYTVLKAYTFLTFDDDLSNQSSVNKHIYGRVAFLRIYPGVQATIYNNSGMALTYRNTVFATSPLLVQLNSSMTGMGCVSGIETARCGSYMKRIQIRPN